MTDTPAPADSVLLRRAQRGDKDAFGELYDRHIRAVYWQAHSIVRDAAQAEDVAQDTFITMWRKRETITPVDSSVLPWLLTTSRYTALNALRSAQRRGTDALDDQTPDLRDVEKDVEAHWAAAEISQAVAALSPIDQQVYELCIEQELTYEQAARALGINHGSVRNRLSRIRSRLRTDLRAVREIA